MAPKTRRMHPAIAPMMIAAKKTVLRPEKEREGKGGEERRKGSRECTEERRREGVERKEREKTGGRGRRKVI
jgi:hypothetical protein